MNSASTTNVRRKVERTRLSLSSRSSNSSGSSRLSEKKKLNLKKEEERRLHLTDLNPLVLKERKCLRCQICNKKAFYLCKKCRCVHYCCLEHKLLDMKTFHPLVCEHVLQVVGPQPFLLFKFQREHHKRVINYHKNQLLEITLKKAKEALIRKEFRLSEIRSAYLERFGKLLYKEGDPHRIQPILISAESLALQGKLDQSKRMLSRAQEIMAQRNPQFPNILKAEFHRTEGIVETSSKDYISALESFANEVYWASEEYHTEHPRVAVGFYNIGSVLFNIGRLRAGISYFKHVVDIWSVRLDGAFLKAVENYETSNLLTSSDDFKILEEEDFVMERALKFILTTFLDYTRMVTKADALSVFCALVQLHFVQGRFNKGMFYDQKAIEVLVEDGSASAIRSVLVEINHLESMSLNEGGLSGNLLRTEKLDLVAALERKDSSGSRFSSVSSLNGSDNYESYDEFDNVASMMKRRSVKLNLDVIFESGGQEPERQVDNDGSLGGSRNKNLEYVQVLEHHIDKSLFKDNEIEGEEGKYGAVGKFNKTRHWNEHEQREPHLGQDTEMIQKQLVDSKEEAVVRDREFEKNKIKVTKIYSVDKDSDGNVENMIQLTNGAEIVQKHPVGNVRNKDEKNTLETKSGISAPRPQYENKQSVANTSSLASTNSKILGWKNVRSTLVVPPVTCFFKNLTKTEYSEWQDRFKILLKLCRRQLGGALSTFKVGGRGPSTFVHEWSKLSITSNYKNSKEIKDKLNSESKIENILQTKSGTRSSNWKVESSDDILKKVQSKQVDWGFYAKL